MHEIVGSFMPPHMTPNVGGAHHLSVFDRKRLAKTVFSAEILTDLNSYDVFHFEFSAQDGDMLVIDFKGESYTFEFQKQSGWRECAASSWRALTEHSCGCAIVDPAQ